MVKVVVNGVEVEVPSDATVLDAAEKAGFKIPTLCHLEGIFDEATCRICVVDIGGRLFPSCRYPVSEGLKVTTESDAIRKYRRDLINLLFATHKIKCWSCVRKGGACTLLNLAKDYGVEAPVVCSECMFFGSDCLVAKGQPCLGPLTIAGCDAECTKNGMPCIGCRGPITSAEVWRSAIEFYEGKVKKDELLSKMKLFWNKYMDVVGRYMEVKL